MNTNHECVDVVKYYVVILFFFGTIYRGVPFSHLS